MNTNSKKIKKRFLAIFTLLLIILLFWFLIFNYLTINKGRFISQSSLIDNDYQSSDQIISLSFIDEEIVKIKYLVDEEKDIYFVDFLNYSFSEGIIYTEETLINETEEKLVFTLLQNDIIFSNNFNKYLYISD